MEFQSYDFDDIGNKLISSHHTVILNGLTVLDENHRWCIFPILPINVQLSFLLHKHHIYKGYLESKVNDCVLNIFLDCRRCSAAEFGFERKCFGKFFFSSVEEHLPLKLPKHIRASSCKLMQALPMAFTSRV